MAYLLNYTRQPMENDLLYSPRLAYSMHLAVSSDGKEFRPLNHNSGVLFVKATENADGSLNPKSLKNPWLFTMPEGRFGVVGIRILADGGEDEESKGSVVLFTSDDLLEYKEVGLLQLGQEYVEKISCCYMPERGKFRLVWQEQTGNCFTAEMEQPEELRLAQSPELCEEKCCADGVLDEIWSRIAPGIEGAVPVNVLEIADFGENPEGKVPAEVADRLCKKLLTPVNTGMEFPEQIEVTKPEELDVAEEYRIVSTEVVVG